MINNSLGLPNRVNRNSFPNEMLEKIAVRGNLVKSMIAEGEIKAFIENNFAT